MSSAWEPTNLSTRPARGRLRPYNYLTWFGHYNVVHAPPCRGPSRARAQRPKSHVEPRMPMSIQFVRCPHVTRPAVSPSISRSHHPRVAVRLTQCTSHSLQRQSNCKLHWRAVRALAPVRALVAVSNVVLPAQFRASQHKLPARLEPTRPTGTRDGLRILRLGLALRLGECGFGDPIRVVDSGKAVLDAATHSGGRRQRWRKRPVGHEMPQVVHGVQQKLLVPCRESSPPKTEQFFEHIDNSLRFCGWENALELEN